MENVQCVRINFFLIYQTLIDRDKHYLLGTQYSNKKYIFSLLKCLLGLIYMETTEQTYLGNIFQ